MDIIISQEQQENLSEFLIDIFKNEGWSAASKIVNGDENLLKILNIKTPMEFLHLYDDLEVVQSINVKDITLFRFVPKLNLMSIDNRRTLFPTIEVHSKDIWTPLRKNFELDYNTIEKFIKQWLGESFGITGVLPEPITPMKTL